MKTAILLAVGLVALGAAAPLAAAEPAPCGDEPCVPPPQPCPMPKDRPEGYVDLARCLVARALP